MASSLLRAARTTALRARPGTAARRFASVDVTIRREALNMAMDEEMEADDAVFVMGEEVAQYQGAYKVTKGLFQKYGERRVIDTPITEMGFAGICTGAAYKDLKPVCEFMTFNFAMQAIDQIVNSAAKQAYMSNGGHECPHRLPGPERRGGGRRGAALAVARVVVFPVPRAEGRGALQRRGRQGVAQGRHPGPEPRRVSGERAIVWHVLPPVGRGPIQRFVLPLGKAHIEREGTDVTLVTFSKMVGYCLDAAEELAAQVSAPRCSICEARPLDRDAIINSVKKTNRLVAVEEGWPQCGIAAEICAVVMESDAFDYLDAPVERVTGADVPMARAIPLEKMSLPQVEDIVAAVSRTTERKMHGVA